jgi:PAS domain S-box-containing protein
VEKAKVLIIEDEIVVAHDLEDMLGQRGYEVVGIVSTGEEAVEKARATNPDLVLADIKLAGPMDGIEAAERIGSELDAAIIYLTARTESDFFERAKETEPYGYLTKPVAPQELLRTVEMAVYKHKMKKRLRESESRFRDIFDHAFQFLGLMTKEGILIEANQGALDFYGLTESDVIGMPFWETPWWTHSAKQQEKVRESVVKAAKGEFARFEAFHPAPDGQVHYMDMSITPVRDDQGNVTLLIPEGRDITDQKMANERLLYLTRVKEDLLTSEDLGTKLKRITAGAVEIFDADFARIWIIRAGDRCDSGCVHAGVTDEPHVCRYRGRCLHLVASSGRYTHIDGSIHRRVPFGCYKIGRIASGEIPKFLTNEVTQDPKVHDREWAKDLGLVSFAGYRLVSSDMQPVGVMGLFAKHPLSTDEDTLLEDLANTTAQIIQTGIAEEAFRESEDRYRQLTQNSLTGIYIHQDDKFVYVNERLADIMGYRSEEILDRNYWEFVHPEDVDKIKKFGRERASDDSAPSEYDFRIVCKNGETKWLEAFITTIHYRGRLATMGNLADVTSRKMSEQERLNQVRFLESMDRIERSIGDTENLEETMGNVLEKALSIFGCDRAWLAYPCDPCAALCSVVIERTVPEFPRVFSRRKDLHVTPELSASFKASLEAKQPVVFHPDAGLPVPDSASQFSIKSSLNYVLAPKIGKAWLLGLSQCSHPRVWTEYDQRLFHEIGDRVSEALNSLLLLRDLRTSERRYRSLFQHSRDAIVISTREGRIVEANNAFSELFGYTPEELVAMPSPELWANPEDRRQWQEELENAGSLRDYEVRIRRKDGETRLCLFSSSLWMADKKDVQYQTICRDITEQRRGQEALLESEQMFRLLSEQSLMSVAILQDGAYRYANQAMSELTGYSIEEILNWKSEQFLKVAHPEDRALIAQQAKMKQLGDPRQKTNYTFRLISKSGPTKWVEIYSKTVQFQGRNANFLTMIDITGRKQAEEQLRQAHKMEAIGTLAGGIAHDVNNLLQVVLGQAEMLLFRNGMDQRSYKSVEAIRRSARNGAELVKRILTFSRQAEIETRPLNLSHEVGRVLELLQRTIPRMIRVEMSLENDLWMIEADSSQLEQILLNLAVNAKDAMPEGGRLLFETENTTLREEYCTTHPEVQPGKYVMLSVSDTGQGIDSRIKDRIFEPFFSTKDPGEGTGLGLSTVFGIVKGHGGHINCYSEGGVGTTFKIYFPVAKMDLPSAMEETIDMPAGGTESLLLVDDEEAVRTLGAEMLEMAGYTVLTATNGREALEIYGREKHRISMVILDLVMPEMSGRACLEELLKINPKAKILIASGYSANGPTKDALESGATGFISKPFDLKQILTAVRKTLDAPARML